MDFVVEAVLEVAGELVSEGIDAAITARKEKKRKAASAEEDIGRADAELIIEKGEETNGSEKFNH